MMAVPSLLQVADSGCQQDGQRSLPMMSNMKNDVKNDGISEY
jgi:hypothetical protein